MRAISATGVSGVGMCSSTSERLQVGKVNEQDRNHFKTK